jgi:hypothetical protein
VTPTIFNRIVISPPQRAVSPAAKGQATRNSAPAQTKRATRGAPVSCKRAQSLLRSADTAAHNRASRAQVLQEALRSVQTRRAAQRVVEQSVSEERRDAVDDDPVQKGAASAQPDAEQVRSEVTRRSLRHTAVVPSSAAEKEGEQTNVLPAKHSLESSAPNPASADADAEQPVPVDAASKRSSRKRAQASAHTANQAEVPAAATTAWRASAPARVANNDQPAGAAERVEQPRSARQADTSPKLTAQIAPGAGAARRQAAESSAPPTSADQPTPGERAVRALGTCNRTPAATQILTPTAALGGQPPVNSVPPALANQGAAKRAGPVQPGPGQNSLPEPAAAQAALFANGPGELLDASVLAQLRGVTSFEALARSHIVSGVAQHSAVHMDKVEPQKRRKTLQHPARVARLRRSGVQAEVAATPQHLYSAAAATPSAQVFLAQLASRHQRRSVM